MENKLKEKKDEKEKINKEKKIIEAKKSDLILKLESIDLIANKYFQNNENNLN